MLQHHYLHFCQTALHILRAVQALHLRPSFGTVLARYLLLATPASPIRALLAWVLTDLWPGCPGPHSWSLQRLQYARAKSDAAAKLDGTFKKEKKHREKGTLAGGCGRQYCWQVLLKLLRETVLLLVLPRALEARVMPPQRPSQLARDMLQQVA